MSGFIWADEGDIADLEAEAAAQRKAANRLCLECNQRGNHLPGCPEVSNADEEDDK